MKLLYCTKCGGVFSLRKKISRCPCGKTAGQYMDELHATYSGPAIPLGFANQSFVAALKNQPEEYDAAGEEFSAFVIAEECPTITKTDKTIKAVVTL